MCIKHEHEHQVITEEFRDKEEINCITVILEVKPQEQDQSNRDEAKYSNS